MFLVGFHAADASRKNKQKNISSSQRQKMTMSNVKFLCQELELKTCIGMTDEKFIDFDLITFEKTNDGKVHKIEKLGKVDDYVYDIETETQEVRV